MSSLGLSTHAPPVHARILHLDGLSLAPHPAPPLRSPTLPAMRARPRARALAPLRQIANPDPITLPLTRALDGRLLARAPWVRIQTLFRALAEIAPDADHREGAGGRGVEDAELVRGEEAREDEGADGHEQADDDGEADGGDGLRDGEGGAEAEELDDDEGPEGGAALDASQRVGGWGQGAVAQEEEELEGDAVGG